MRILVTGGAGYIGSHAVRRFREAGHLVWVLDNLSRGHRAAAGDPAYFHFGAIGDRPLVERLLGDHRIEAVVHFAALAYVGESVRWPLEYYQVDLADSITLLSAMRRCGVSQLVFSSSCATYGIAEELPVTESAPQRPITPYGRAKLGVEWVLADLAAADSLAYAALRYFNAAGAHPEGDLGEDHDPETHLIPLALQAAAGQRPRLDVFGTDYPTPDGTCIRDYVHVCDLADAHLAALERLRPGVGLCCNLGTGRGHSVREVIQACEAVTGKEVPLRYGPRRPGDPPALYAAARKAHELLGWQPRFPDLPAIVATAWRWHAAHPRGYGDAAAP